MLRSTFIAFVVLAGPSIGQNLWTVASDGTGDFTQVQAAIDAASDGDTILVHSGTYAPVLIDGKGLTIHGTGDPLPVIQPPFLPAPTFPPFQVRDVAANQTVIVRGLRMVVAYGDELETVAVRDCDGPVLFEDFESATTLGEAAVVSDCESVTFVDCTLHSSGTSANTGFGTFFSYTTYIGLAVTSSNVFLENCSVEGSNGGDASWEGIVLYPPAPTGAGLRLNNSSALASGCTFIGGNAGSDPNELCFAGEDGAPGIELVGNSTVRLRDTNVIGGSGGTGGCGNPDGIDGPAQSIAGGSASIALPGSARRFVPDSPVADGGLIHIRMDGEPGDFSILHIGQDLIPGVWIDSIGAAIHLPLPPLSTFAFGTVPASGVIDLPLAVPPLAGGYATFTGQAVFVATDGVYETAPRSTLMVSSKL